MKEKLEFSRQNRKPKSKPISDSRREASPTFCFSTGCYGSLLADENVVTACRQNADRKLTGNGQWKWRQSPDWPPMVSWRPAGVVSRSIAAPTQSVFA